MPIILSFPQDITGEDYIAFIHAAVPRFDSFTLSWPQDLPLAGGLRTISQDLRGHELDREQDMILYRLDQDAIPVLLRRRRSI